MIRYLLYRGHSLSMILECTIKYKYYSNQLLIYSLAQYRKFRRFRRRTPLCLIGLVATNQRMQIYPVMGLTITGKLPQH
uniref:Uncharacterized protein n=1 Tax=Vibrio tapetis TaxID=52443 RepID=E3NYV6_9VIBR|nr:hypothetical protein pVT1_72 [Vibrio tapetis]